jgi:2-oxoglutarate dehydrogenase E2 component (dihydrolipoamide succinyltransferase)
MADKIVMPQLGESIAEGTIVRWLKKPGDDVKKDEDLLIISTDKVEAEIPAPASGVLLSVDVAEGKTVGVGTVLGYVGARGEASPSGGNGKPASAATTPSANPPAPREEAPGAVPSRASPSSSSSGASSMSASASMQVATAARAMSAPPEAGTPRMSPSTSAGRFVSPLVRRIAGDNNVSDAELDSLAGTGQNGRVTKKDLLTYVDAKRAGRVQPIANVPPPRAAQGVNGAVAQSRGPSVSIPQGERELVKPASSMRKVIMQNMVASKHTSAHVHTFFDVDWTNVEKVRRAHKDRFKAEEGVNLTYTVFMAAAVASCLKRHSYLNAEIRGTDVVFKKDVHLGMAVAIEEPEPGLMVPVIKNADQMNLRGLAHSITDLATRVRTRKIKPDELSGSTFTITNPGNYGAIIGTPVINQPNVAILGMGKVAKQPVVIDVDGTDALGIRVMSVISLGFDHRLIDGATADQFMADVKKTLETWTAVP